MAAKRKEELKALTFQGIDVKFDWPREEWEHEFWPNINLAIAALKRDDKELQEVMAKMVKDGLAPSQLDIWCDARDCLRTMAHWCDTALSRSFVVLERLGYSPDNPPPESRIN